MSKTMDCVCGTKILSKQIANFKFVHFCHGIKTETERNKQLNLAKMVGFFVLDHFS